MPFPEFDRTVDELDQPWLFGLQAGAHYRNILRRQFNAAWNRPQIDAALSLGNYLVHSEANRKQRAALRAVMLANFLVKSYPVGQQNQLKRRYENLGLQSLKHAFTCAFPALHDSGNRQRWRPDNLTDPATLNSLMRARSSAGPQLHFPLQPFRFIIHGVGNYMGDVFDNPNILKQYEVLSMSLMSNMNVHAHDPQGVILKVHENNILAASPTDVGVLNYAPGFDPSNPGAMTITDNLIEIAAQTGGLRSPDYLLNHVRNYPYYNEVVVCGRTGVPLPHGLTREMEVVGFFMLTDTKGVIRGDPNTRKNREMRVKACALNYHLPLLYIPNTMAVPGA